MTLMRRLVVVSLTVCASPAFTPLAAQIPGDGGGPRRQQLEQRFRERMSSLIQQRLGLTNDQLSRLEASNRQFEERRVDLMRRERSSRQQLRMELSGGDQPNETRVSQLLDETMKIHRQRVELLESEQRELAKFLTPVQRAKYFGLQNEIRRRAQELGQRGMRPGARRRPVR